MELAYKIFIFPSFNIDNVFKYKPSLNGSRYIRDRIGTLFDFIESPSIYTT